MRQANFQIYDRPSRAGRVVKTPTETVTVYLDYSRWLESGETLSTVSAATATVTTPAMTFTATLESTTVVKLIIAAGADAYDYKAEVTVTTSAAQTKENFVFVAVRDIASASLPATLAAEVSAQLLFNASRFRLATIAELTALGKSLLQDDDSAFVNDSSTGGMFYWDASSTATDDGSTILEADEGGTGRWLLALSNSNTTAYTPGGTDVTVADGGTGASTATDARANLGLDDMATQNAGSVTITGGAISGTTVTLRSTAAPTPTTEGEIWWDSEDDQIKVGDGAATKVFSDDSVMQAAPAEGPFVDGDKTKLDGIETSADVTDAANVAAAGAVMDSDFGSNGLMKRTGAGAYGTATDGTDYLSPTTGTLAYANRTAIKAAGLSAGATVFNRETNYQDPYTLTSGDYSSEVDDYATLTDDAIANTTAAWVRRFNRPPRPQDFGGTDQASFQRAITYAQRETGILEVIGNFTLDDDLSITSDLSIVGKPGANLLDFSSRTGYASQTDSGLIKVRGTQGTSTNLAANATIMTGALARVSSASQTTTVITFNTDVPHGLSVGDLFWTQGEVHATMVTAGNEDTFYTFNGAVSNSLAQIAPFTVATVPGPTSLTVTSAVSQSATLTSTQLFLFAAANAVKVVDASTYTAGDDVMIVSDAVRQVTGGDYPKIGELNKVTRVDATNDILYMHTAVRDNYLTADTAKVIPVSMLKTKISGLNILGSGPNTGTGANLYGDRGIHVYLADNPEITNCNFDEVDQMGVLTRNCRNVKVTHNTIRFNSSNEAGRTDDDLDIQYGFADDNADGGFWGYNYVNGGRHAWDNSGVSGGTTYFGIARNIIVAHNTFVGQWWSAIGTHNCIEKMTVHNNYIYDAHTGVDVRWCEDISIHHNHIVAKQYPVLLKTVLHKVDVSNNHLDGGVAPVRIHWAKSDDTDLTLMKGPITVNSNYLRGGSNAVIVDELYNDREAYIEIDDNLVEGCTLIPFQITVSPTSGATGFFNGSVSRNTFRNLETASAQTAVIRLYNAQFVSILDNIFDLDGGDFNYGIACLGNSGSCKIGGTRYIGAEPNTARTLTVGTGHYGSDIPFVLGEISSGAYTLTRDDDHMVLLDGEGSSADNFDQIIGLRSGQRVTIVRQSPTLTVRDQSTSGVAFDAGALQLPGGTSITLDNDYKSITFLGTGSVAYPVAVIVANTV